MNKFEYKKLCPFKWYVLQNFPFIEADFDAITNYQLYCKVIEYLNKLINDMNAVGQQTENITNAMTDLQDYVNNYFNNLDVQDEINNKLDEMAESGELAEIIEDYATIPELTQRIENVEKNAIYIGNSYTEGTGSTDGHTGLFQLTKDLFKNAYKYVTSGGGFLRDVNHLTNFEDLLDLAISDTSFNNNTITDVIIIGAWGESRIYGELGRTNFLSNIANAMNSFVDKVKLNFPNIKNIKYIWAESRNEHNHTSNGILNVWHNMFDIHNIMKDYAPVCGIQYCGWIGFNTLMNSNYFSNDNIHPNDLGYKKLSALFKECYNGNLTYSQYYQYFNTQNQINNNSFVRGFFILNPENAIITINRVFIATGDTPDVNSVIKLIDQTDLKYIIPESFGYTLNIGYLSIATESTFNASNNLILQVSIDVENNIPYIKGTTKNKKTLAAGIDNSPTNQSIFIIPFTNR